jgi:hypothetical protein
MVSGSLEGLTGDPPGSYTGLMRQSRALLGVAAAVAAVGAVTASARVGLVPVSALVGSPEDVATGKMWLPVSSALVADNPVIPSLLAFALFATAAVLVCGVRMTLVAAALGHVGSTLIVYLSLAAARAVNPAVLQDVVERQDYGVSAVFAAWLGAIAFVAWTRRRTRRERLAVVAFCTVCGLIGWAADSALTVLDTDHLVAFAIGAGLAGARVPGRLRVSIRQRRGTAPRAAP